MTPDALAGRTRLTLRAAATTALMTSVLILGACTANEAHDDSDSRLAPSLSALAEQRLTEKMSDWDRAVLEKAKATGAISQADYDEGADNFEACLRAGGLQWVRTRLMNGVVDFQPPRGTTTPENAASVQWDCYDSTYGETQELFRLQQANPDLLSDFSVAAARCLREAGVVSDDFTAEDFDAATGPQNAPGAERPFDFSDLRARTCLASLGYAIVVDTE